MDSGGLAVNISSGNRGPEIRSDVYIEVQIGDRFTFEFDSSTSPLYDDAIREQILSLANEFGNPACHLKIYDSGALPFVWRARLISCFRQITGSTSMTPQDSSNAHPPRLRRTRLYVPGNTPKLFTNASLFAPDCLIFDLEESVPVEKKLDALILVGEALSSLQFRNIEIMVRINSGDSGLYEVEYLSKLPVSTFIVPKVEGPNYLNALDGLLSNLNSTALLFPLIESALGVENSFTIASCPRVTALSLGLEDYIADIRATRSESQIESLFARSRIVNAARAAGITPLASVFPTFNDPKKITHYVNEARKFGYEGIGCIHPSQIEVVHQAFVPTEAELQAAKEIVTQFERAQTVGLGVVNVGGRMVDLPSYQQAQQVLKFAEVKL